MLNGPSTRSRNVLSSQLNLSASTHVNVANEKPSETKRANVVRRLQQYMANKKLYVEQLVCDVQRESSGLKAACEAWERAGVLSVLSSLDEDAVGEVGHLASACAALKLDVNEAMCHASRVAAVSCVVDDALKADARHGLRMATLSRTQASLRASAVDLQYGRDVAHRSNADTSARANAASSFAEKAEIMAVKARQYDEATANLTERVRINGLSHHCTHDVIAEDLSRLTQIEQDLANANTSLQLFHELPAVSLFQCNFGLLLPSHFSLFFKRLLISRFG